MSFASVLAQLEAQAPLLRAVGRETFLQIGGATIIHGGLDAEETQAAHRRLAELAETMPVVLVTNADRDEASRLCRTAAHRLTSAPWYPTVIESWPAPIAHELASLVACLSDTGAAPPSPEAALLQVRDLSETLVKLPAVVFARHLIERGGADADAMRRALASVSGGGWNELARNAAARIVRAEPSDALAKVATLFESGRSYAALLGRLTTARNDAIGHGALRPNPAETAALVSWFVAGQVGDTEPSGPRGKIPGGVTIATGLAAAVAEGAWAGLRLEAEDDNGPIDLTGAASLSRWHRDQRHHHHHDQTLPLWLSAAGGDKLRLSPLLGARICRECGRRDVFFFDTIYDRKPWKVDFIDYGRGHKSRLSVDVAADLLDELRPEPPAPGEKTSGSLDSRAAIIALEAMRVDRRYRSPTYLRQPFAEFLSSHDRGLYWLQAPAHVGKTMFTLGLTRPELGDTPIAPGLGPGDGIATFFCKREYREGWITFLNALSDSLKVGLDLGDQNQFPTPEQVTKAADPRAAFVIWLQAWRALARSRDKLLVVIDGLDETDPPGPNSLLSLLPKADALPAGLYLLLTSRPVIDKDCPAWLGPALVPLVLGAWARNRVLGLEDAGYRALMAAYARDRLGSAADPAEIEAIIVRAEGRFVFLSFLVEQRRFGAENAGEETGAALYERFLNGLEPRYGSKRAEGLLAVLATLTAAELAHSWIFGEGAVHDEAAGGILEPTPRDFPGLELEMLAIAADMDEVAPDGRRLSLAFVEALLLLQGVLWVWRGEGGVSRYRIGLKEFAAVLEQRQRAELARARTRLAGACLDAVEALAPVLAADAAPDPVMEHLLHEAFPLLPALVAQSGSTPLQLRFETVPVGEVAFFVEARHGSAKTASAAQIRWYNALLGAYARNSGPPDTAERRRNDLASAYVNRGVAKQSAPGFGPGAAIADYDAAIALREALRDGLGEGWSVPWRNDLASAYVNRGNAKQDAPGFGPGAAIADYDAAIALMEALRDGLGEGWPVPWRNDLASAYVNRGNAKQSARGFGPGAAIADYDAAIALREALRDGLGEGWPVPWRNDLARAYMNRGVAKQSAPGFGPGAAIADYDAAIALMEALRDGLGEGWPVPWRNYLAGAYVNWGNAKQSAPGFGPGAAIADYDAAIALMEALRDGLGEDWPVPWRNDLASAYVNRGNAKQSAPGFGPGAAIADYDAAIALREALRDGLGEGWPVPWRNDLASAYMNRGVAKQSAPGFGPGAAIADYDAAIALMEALRDGLGEDWPVPWRNDLASAYMNRGNAKQDAPGFGPGAAIADYDAAIALMEALRDGLGEGWPVPWRNDLAGAYVNRGNAKQDAPGFGPGAAIADYDAAIALMEALRDGLGEGWPVPWRNDLARAYVNRGNAKQDAPGFGPGAAIADYDAAIALREALRDGLGEGWPVPWRNDLANAYMNRGNAKQSAPGFGPGAAIADYDAAIALMEALRDGLGEDWPVPWRNDLAGAYMNRGIAKQDAPGFSPGAAIADYDAAIASMEALRDGLGEDWPVPWRNDLAGAYVNRGNAKQDAPGFGPGAAIADYDAAIALMEALRDGLGEGWPVPWRNDLARAYVNRGNAKQDAPGFGPGAAIADYDAAIALMEALRDGLGEGWPVPWRNDLARAYVNRGVAKQDAPGFGPGAAIADFDLAIPIWTVLQAEMGDQFPESWDYWFRRTRAERERLAATNPD